MPELFESFCQKALKGHTEARKIPQSNADALQECHWSVSQSTDSKVGKLKCSEKHQIVCSNQVQCVTRVLSEWERIVESHWGVQIAALLKKNQIILSVVAQVSASGRCYGNGSWDEKEGGDKTEGWCYFSLFQGSVSSRKPMNRLPRGIVDVLSLEAFKARLDEALSNLV